ncbi:MAG: toxic anion resistance protein [Firmicutes bacterium]|nr:toxic anion resistance protein [Bacillota bacterium]
MNEKDQIKLTLSMSPELDEIEQTVAALVDLPEEGTATAAAAAPPAPEPSQTLTPEELAQVKEFSEKIDIANSNQVLMYGSAAQKNIAEFSDQALESVRSKDLGQVGEMISDLTVELRGLGLDEDKKGLAALFRRGANRVATIKARYDKAEANVDQISGELEKQQAQLLKDIAMLDQMYDRNALYLKELTMYIAAGQQRLNRAKNEELPALLAQAQAGNGPEEAQAANDYAALIDRFEKKLHDLDLTRTIAIQLSPQIRLVQNNDALMAEKIQSSLMNAIPLWKNQMVLALGITHSQQALDAQHQVTELTNELLKKNAETLHTGAVATAKETERGIVDIETLVQTNRLLIDTLDEVVKIQDEGRAKRQEAEGKLRALEGELKQKLLQLNA